MTELSRRTLIIELESLIRRINRANAATLVEGGTLTDALARRAVLRLWYGILTSAADAAAGEGQRGIRRLRSELKMVPATSPREPWCTRRRRRGDLPDRRGVTHECWT